MRGAGKGDCTVLEMVCQLDSELFISLLENYIMILAVATLLLGLSGASAAPLTDKAQADLIDPVALPGLGFNPGTHRPARLDTFQ